MPEEVHRARLAVEPAAELLEHRIRPVEDAAEALGATYKGRSVGTFGRAGIFSFNGNKIITTSGGGMLVSDDARLIAHAKKLATQARDPAPYYEHSQIGYNYRMSNLLAAIGRGQLRVLQDRDETRSSVDRLMGSKPEARFEFIQTNAEFVTDLDV